MNDSSKTTSESAQSMRPRRWFLLAGIFAFVGLVVGVFLISDRLAQKAVVGFPNLQDYEFKLIDHNGLPTSLAQFQGKPVALFFGFTYCPDICPATMMNLTAARDDLAAHGIDPSALQILFVTVDPERDTPEQLGQYLGLFDADIVGLTGTADDVRAVLKQFGIYAQKVDQGGGDYLYDHSAAVFLYRADGSLKGTIIHNEPEQFVVEKLKSIL
jgi:protein SCO1/2